MAMGLHRWASILACCASKAHLWRYVAEWCSTISAISHSMLCISLAACHADCVTFPDTKALPCYFKSSVLPVCPVYSFGQLPHKIRYTTPAWSGCTDLVRLSEQGAGHYFLVDQWVVWWKMEILVRFGLLTKHWCWEGSIVVISYPVWLKGQCSFQFLLMINRMVSSIEFRCRWNRRIRLHGSAVRISATYPEGGWNSQVLTPLFSTSSITK